jgi:hypothetical protein
MFATSLPTENADDKAVSDFGIGMYNVPVSKWYHGEDDEDLKSEALPNGPSLPDGGGPEDPFGPDRLLSYPQTFSSCIHDNEHEYEYDLDDETASAGLPGDFDRPSPSRRLQDDTIQTVADSKLPNDADNPSSRSDYYDHMNIGIDISDVWADEDSGAWASNDKKSLPGVTKNNINMENELGALGNAWSGHVLEDVTGPYGFPATELSENADFPSSENDDGGRVMASGGISMTRLATNIKLVDELTTGFLKKFGKKDLTRRHVLAYLQTLGHPQFLASDMIRCLKLRHSIYVKDVLDEFPVMKKASIESTNLDSVVDKIIDLAVLYRHNPDIVRTLRTCAAKVSLAACFYEKAARRYHV